MLNDARLASSGFCVSITPSNRNKNKNAAILDFRVPLCVAYNRHLDYTLCSTNYMTCTVLHYVQQTTRVLHYVQQTTWVLHYVQQTTWLAQSYTMFNKLHEPYTMFNKLHDLHSLTLHSTNYMTCTVQTKYWTFSAAMIFSCNIKYSRLSWVHPPFLSHSKI